MMNIAEVAFLFVAVGISVYFDNKSDSCFFAYLSGLVIGCLSVLIEIVKDGGCQ